MGRLQDMMSVVARADQWSMMESLLGMKLVPGKAFRSPLRGDDEHPSFNAWKGTDGKVRWKDFAMENGDIYHLIMSMRGCTFGRAVTEAYEMATGGLIMPLPSNNHVHMPPKPHNYAHITAQKREWEQCDSNYWTKYGVGPQEAKNGRLIPINVARIVTDKRPDGYSVNHSYSNPLYAWWFNTGPSPRYKLYRPLNPDRKFRFISNSTRDDIYGLDTMKRNMPGIIVGGQKDALVSNLMWECGAVAFNSEGMMPDSEQMMLLISRCSRLYIMYDMDEAGRTNQARIVQQYPFVTPLSFKHPAAKDPADLRELKEWGIIESIKEKIT